MPWNSHITDAFINLSIQQSIPLIKICWSLCSEIFGGKYFSVVPAFVYLSYVKWSMQYDTVCQYSVDATLAFFAVVGQLLRCVWLFPMAWTEASQAALSITISCSLLKVRSIVLVVPSNHIILCHPLIFLFSIFSSIRVFSNELALCIRWPKYWSFSFSISASNKYLKLISFRIDWIWSPCSPRDGFYLFW